MAKKEWSARYYDRNRRAYVGRGQKLRERRMKVWGGFKSPEGKVWGPIVNLRAFCRAFGLDPDSLRAVDLGINKSSKGWVRASNYEVMMEGEKWEEGTGSIYVVGPNGEELGPVEGPREIKEVARFIGATFAEVLALLQGEVERVGGWRRRIGEG